ncbi:MAG TPA: hypothetical protein VFW00_03555, partial [Rhodocyclaceae bacterium]|nr:hypothetical protein [Rhodocyclaceae bacterium]
MSISSRTVALILATVVQSAVATSTMAANPDESLGRLFYTPQRRAILDELRSRNVRITPEQQADSVRLDGIVHSSNGHNTVWINGQSHHDKPPVESLGDRSARVFSGNGHSVEVKVG